MVVNICLRAPKPETDVYAPPFGNISAHRHNRNVHKIHLTNRPPATILSDASCPGVIGHYAGHGLLRMKMTISRCRWTVAAATQTNYDQ
jgi:hypothetical protein